jgi:hypothetical protein
VTHHDIALQIHNERAARSFRAFDQPVRMLERMEIRPADSTGQGFDQRFATPRFRGCDIGDDQLFVAHHGCTHGDFLRGEPLQKLR